MAREEMGGEVILLADASIFINSMLDVGDEWGNRELVRRLVAYRPTLLVEQLVSMTAVPEGPGRLVHHLRNSPDLQVILILLMLTLPAWILLRQPAFLKSRDEMSEEDAESPPACTGQESSGNDSVRQTRDDPGEMMRPDQTVPFDRLSMMTGKQMSRGMGARAMPRETGGDGWS